MADLTNPCAFALQIDERKLEVLCDSDLAHYSKHTLNKVTSFVQKFFDLNKFYIF